MNPLTRKLTDRVIHTNFRVKRAMRRLRLRKIKNAITDVIGAPKMNQRKNISAIFQRGQNGMARSIGNEKRKSTNASKHGKHHANTTPAPFRWTCDSCEGATPTS